MVRAFQRDSEDLQGSGHAAGLDVALTRKTFLQIDVIGPELVRQV